MLAASGSDHQHIACAMSKCGETRMKLGVKTVATVHIRFLGGSTCWPMVESVCWGERMQASEGAVGVLSALSTVRARGCGSMWNASRQAPARQ